MSFIIFFVSIVLLIFLLVFMFRYVFSNRFSVLVYHKVTSDDNPDFLTVTLAQLSKQFQYLNDKGYATVSLSDLQNHLQNKKPLPRKSVMITLDDGYLDNYQLLYPLLEKYNIKANIFLVADFINPQQQGNCQNKMGTFMTAEDLLSMKSDLVQFGLHSYDHKNYRELSLELIDSDIKLSKEKFRSLSIPFEPSIAYTYGIYTRNDHREQQAFFEVLKNNGINLGFRVGNKNEIPTMNNYDQFTIGRVNISGSFSFWKFKMALWGYIKVLENKAVSKPQKMYNKSQKHVTSF